MRRYVPLLVAGLALIVAACSDTTSPVNEPARLIKLGDRGFAMNVSASEDAGAVQHNFNIPAAGGVVRVGEFWLIFASNSVCDPQTSGYGPDHWLRDCQTINSDFAITAKFYKTADGRSHVDFSPDIRFHPEKYVGIVAVRTELKGKTLTSDLADKYNLWFTLRDGTTRYFVDEPSSDAAVATKFDTSNGLVWRRLRHFSGYVVHVGYCSENPNAPECQGGGGGGGN